MTGSESGVIAVHRALRDAVGTVYRNPVATVTVSLGWLVASLPLVTVGPATLGAYAAVRSVVATGELDRSAVTETVTAHWLDAVLFSGLLGISLSTAVLYLSRYAATGAGRAGLLGVVSLYLLYHVGVVVAMSLVSLAGGTDVASAVSAGYTWSVRRPLATVLVGVVTGALFVVCALLTVALPLVFPALAAAFHTELAASPGSDRADAADDRPAIGEPIR